MAELLDVAEYILEQHSPMPTMKLHKLLYYCQAWCLVTQDRPMFSEDFQAWPSGPVIPELFELHRGKFLVRHGELYEAYRDRWGDAAIGTNYYIRRKKPTIHETVHICKRSWGWRTSWQETTNDGTENAWPRWCDEDPSRDENGEYVTGNTLPWEIHSVEDIRRYLRTGEWELIDEYGEAYPDWESEIADLVAWDGGKAGWNERHPDEPVTWDVHEHDVESGEGYRDHENNIMCRMGFC